MSHNLPLSDAPRLTQNFGREATTILTQGALSIGGDDYGFIVIGINQPKKQKKFHLHVIYLFVSKQSRRKKITELEGLQASEYMMGNIISQALETSAFLPITSIVLETASDKLFPLYESLGFSRLPDMADWMSLPLPH